MTTPTPTPITRKPRPASTISSGLTLAKPFIYRDHAVYPTSRSPTPQDIRHLTWDPLGALIAVADTRVLRLWDPTRPDLKASTELKPPPSETAAKPKTRGIPRVTATEKVVFNPAAPAELACLSADGSLRLWDVRARSPHLCSIAVAESGLGLTWRPARAGGDEIVASTRGDRIVAVSRRMERVISTTQWERGINAPVFSNSGTALLVPGLNGVVSAVSFPGLEVKRTVGVHPSAVNVVALDLRGRHMATAGSDANVSVWSTGDLMCRGTYPSMLSGPARSVSFSFDGAYIVAGDEGGGVGFEGLSVVHVESGEELCKVPVQAEGKRGVSEVAWHPARYWIAFAGGREGEGGLKVAGVGGGLL